MKVGDKLTPIKKKNHTSDINRWIGKSVYHKFVFTIVEIRDLEFNSTSKKYAKSPIRKEKIVIVERDFDQNEKGYTFPEYTFPYASRRHFTLSRPHQDYPNLYNYFKNIVDERKDKLNKIYSNMQKIF